MNCYLVILDATLNMRAGVQDGTINEIPSYIHFSYIIYICIFNKEVGRFLSRQARSLFNQDDSFIHVNTSSRPAGRCIAKTETAFVCCLSTFPSCLIFPALFEQRLAPVLSCENVPLKQSHINLGQNPSLQTSKKKPGNLIHFFLH